MFLKIVTFNILLASVCAVKLSECKFLTQDYTDVERLLYGETDLEDVFLKVMIGEQSDPMHIGYYRLRKTVKTNPEGQEYEKYQWRWKGEEARIYVDHIRRNPKHAHNGFHLSLKRILYMPKGHMSFSFNCGESMTKGGSSSMSIKSWDEESECWKSGELSSSRLQVAHPDYADWDSDEVQENMKLKVTITPVTVADATKQREEQWSKELENQHRLQEAQSASRLEAHVPLETDDQQEATGDAETDAEEEGQEESDSNGFLSGLTGGLKRVAGGLMKSFW